MSIKSQRADGILDASALSASGYHMTSRAQGCIINLDADDAEVFHG